MQVPSINKIAISQIKAGGNFYKYMTKEPFQWDIVTFQTLLPTCFAALVVSC